MARLDKMSLTLLLAMVAVPFGVLEAALIAAQNAVAAPTAFTGMCDASAAVALNETLFAVANDEDNVIRIYDSEKGDRPIASIELSAFLKVDPKWPETDLEGAAWLGNRIFWIGSHGRNKDGKFRASRDRFFATTVQTNNSNGITLVPVEKPYTQLLRDLIREPKLKPYKLSAASKLPPKHPGGLNIEGLCATPDKHLLIGFRNPIPRGRALLVPLLNPNEVIAGKPAAFGFPFLLNLGGRGIRDIGFWHGRYLLVAGSYDAEGVSQVYLWRGGTAEPQLLPGIDLHNFNPEAVIVYPHTPDSFQLLSDDGTMVVGGVPCKLLPDPMQKHFRSVWVTPGGGAVPAQR